MYTSTLQDGSPTVVTGTIIDPTAPWHGHGPRPTIVMAPGTVGQGDQCAPSKLVTLPISINPNELTVGLNYEVLFADLLLAQGYRVIMTDYIGLGTPGIHTYVNRVEEGHAVLDAARAALRYGRLPASSPVGFWGYSQGGGATASAAEMAPDYAPELTVEATYAGAPPADLAAVLQAVDGTAIAGVIGYTVNGLVARYPALRPIIDRETTSTGRDALETLSKSCLLDTAVRYGFHTTAEWTSSRQRLSRVITRYPAIERALSDQQIGNLVPTTPVLVDTGINDDIIPRDQVIAMTRKWIKHGADVTVINDGTPPIFPRAAVNHVLPYLFSAAPALAFFDHHFTAPR